MCRVNLTSHLISLLIVPTLFTETSRFANFCQGSSKETSQTQACGNSQKARCLLHGTMPVRRREEVKAWVRSQVLVDGQEMALGGIRNSEHVKV